ncbi:hypothetical protein COS81_02715 [candidate division WWE3 bacterium CG06_land_8_20_14_3_00_42_16]|uniref:Big-1 domain-containing protein n=4 Tax=Katanobacteria TaxID=422282 RepID=A0A2M7AMY9_UNCKA|nr:MAG: hypothetical protein COS81_02715 [candidate division WWE3 bacterium CG06_land_8_20_14_3_00_42_16]PIZ42129.1 MAG: hypothetical protein COY34_03375 [candidate division WWE3 bacterium CG_4_10_14_0_2_um_filter_42_8]PJA38049.1 MAG: hypothetical protein CO181_01255 [candidate division WWE3 bacterium CG_4_9_14_3_um_filter_43_9]PJC68731.1 MAG: hypothetical protein CO015_02965 [candidate division WWE3 bacterium CG_4_8_14_3_um_filter_42_11]
MKKLGSILFITILLLLTVSGLFRGQVSAASTKSTIQILLEVKEKLYQIKVTILDESGEPIEGAKVTLYSEPITKYTDENGVVVFENVSPGEHRIVVEHEGQIGEQKVVLSGQVETFDFRVKLELANPFNRRNVIAIIGILVSIVGFLLVLVFRMRRRG